MERNNNEKFRSNSLNHQDESNKDPLIGKVFFKSFKVERAIGEGSFGKIYTAISEKTKEKFAIKLEKRETNKNLLELEAYILCHVKGFGVPFVKSYGYNSTYNILVMELMGDSLEEKFQKNNKKFSVKTTCMIGIQMVERIAYVHSKHIMHRDIKPDNFVMGRGNKKSFVHILDFGLSKKYWSTRHKKHIPYITGKKLTGTARYASIHALSGEEQSRRDDLESIGYVLMYFLRGSLPWQGLKVADKEDRYLKIRDKKRATSAEDLCKGFPKEFEEFVKYTRKLEFTQEPDYKYLTGLLEKVLKDNNETMDYWYDWEKQKPNIEPSVLEELKLSQEKIEERKKERSESTRISNNTNEITKMVDTAYINGQSKEKEDKKDS